MWKHQNLLLSALLVLKISLGLAVYTHLLAEYGSRIDASCTQQKCDRNINEQVIETIESYMNPGADPCEDFYEYACGNWRSHSEYNSTFEQHEENFRQLLVDTLQKLEADKRSSGRKLNEAYEKALHYYHSCLEIKAFELRQFLVECELPETQQWPIYENRTTLPWNFDKFIWWKVLAKLQSYNFNDGLLEVIIDDFESKKYAINIAGPDKYKKLILDDQIFDAMGNYSKVQRNLLKWKLERFEKKLVKTLEKAHEDAKPKKRNLDEIRPEMIRHYDGFDHEKFLNILLDKTQHGMLTKGASGLKEFMDSLFDSSVPNERRHYILKNVFIDTKESPNLFPYLDELSSHKYLSLEDLQNKFPIFNWQAYFEIYLNGAVLPQKADIITIPNIKAVAPLMIFYSKTSKETLALYMLARFLQYLKQDLPKIDQKATTCIDMLSKLMPLTVNHLYEEYHYGAIRNESDLAINDLFKRMKLRLNSIFENSDIELAADEIDYLKQKNAKMSLNIGNLPANKTVEFLASQYAPAHITNTSSFYHNHLELLRNRRQLMHRSLDAGLGTTFNVYETFDALELGRSASPFFEPARNRITLPFSYLRLPLYHHKLHDVFQFAELGWSLGHEIMHAFDTNGLMFDALGNYRTFGQQLIEKKSFSEKIACFEEKATASIDERIADISGLHLVIRTFLNDRNAKTHKFHTHSTKLSNRQLFFVKLSQYFCDKNTSSTNDTDLNTLDHDLSDVRVVYSMANTREFAHEFKCQNKSAMKIKQICSLW